MVFSLMNMQHALQWKWNILSKRESRVLLLKFMCVKTEQLSKIERVFLSHQQVRDTVHLENRCGVKKSHVEPQCQTG